MGCKEKWWACHEFLEISILSSNCDGMKVCDVNATVDKAGGHETGYSWKCSEVKILAED